MEIGTIGNSDGLTDAFDHVRRSGGASWHLLHPLAIGPPLDQVTMPDCNPDRGTMRNGNRHRNHAESDEQKQRPGEPRLPPMAALGKGYASQTEKSPAG